MASKLVLCVLHKQLTESKSMQALCQIYAAVSYICIGDSESSTQVKFLVIASMFLLYTIVIWFFIFSFFLSLYYFLSLNSWTEIWMQALDLIGPVYRMMDSFVGVREKTSCLFAYGLLLMKQQDLQEAR